MVPMRSNLMLPLDAWCVYTLNSIFGGKVTSLFIYYRPQTKFVKVMILQVSVCPHWGGACMVSGGACVVAPRGACVVAPRVGGMHGCSQGACVAASGGHA